MATPHNVIQLNQRPLQVEAVKLPVSVIKLRDRCAQHVRKLLVRLFQQIDDNLFERAENAGSNSGQNLFFDAMREIRLKKDQIAGLCVQGINEDFRFTRQVVSRQTDDFDADNLTVLGNDELEERVAKDAMVRRSREQVGREYEHLTLRLDAIITGARVDEANNPLGPQCLVERFVEACETLEVDIQVRLTLYKQFEKQVLVHLGKVYEAANKYLVEQGIMPDLHNTKPARSGGVRPSPGAGVFAGNMVAGGSGSAASLSSDGDTFEMLRQLMAQVPAGIGLPAGSALAGPGAGPVMPQQTLMHVLSQVQHQLGAQAVMQPLDYQKILASAQQEQGSRVGQMDQDIMNLVSLLFDYILSDRNIPVKMKALLGRLQIPLLKVAILDRGFFSKSSHPARRLLNELASSSIGWTESEQGEDPFLKRVEAIVDTLVNDFDRDIGLFERTLEGFQVFVEGDRKRRQLLEQRIRDAEDGKAKSDQARKAVQGALNEALAGYQVPALTLKVLHDAWSNYMVLLALRNGTTSAPWKQAGDTARQLVLGTASDASEPLDTDRIERLMGQLKKGLEEASYPEFERNRLISKVEALLRETAQSRIVDCVDLDDDFLSFDEGVEIPLERVTLPPEPLAADTGVTTPAVTGADQALSSSEQPLMQAASPIDEEDRQVVEGRIELVKEEPQDAGEAESTVAQEALSTVDALSVGCWVEIRENEERRFRAKLAAVIQTSGKYIFVNRLGVKVAEKSRIALALAIKHGAITVLDDSQLFDRALQAVIGSLRTEKR